MCPKKSGENLDDVIEYVRSSMYREQEKAKQKRTESDEEIEDEEGEDIDVAASATASISHKTSGKPSHSSNVCSGEEGEEEDEVLSDESDSGSEAESQDETEVPKDYLFPSFYVFVLHGPFVPPSDRLDINLMDNKDRRKGDRSRAELRKKESKEKAIDSVNDATATRGFTTDQRIEIENLGVQRESMIDRKNEVAMVALTLEESAMSKLIEAAERRAAQRCPEYNPENPFWKKVDSLLVEQEKLMAKISGFNDSVLKRKTSICEVSEFLNSPSPAPKKKRDEDLTVGDGVGDDSEEDQGDDVDGNKKQVS